MCSSENFYDRPEQGFSQAERDAENHEGIDSEYGYATDAHVMRSSSSVGICGRMPFTIAEQVGHSLMTISVMRVNSPQTSVSCRCIMSIWSWHRRHIMEARGGRVDLVSSRASCRTPGTSGSSARGRPYRGSAWSRTSPEHSLVLSKA